MTTRSWRSAATVRRECWPATPTRPPRANTALESFGADLLGQEMGSTTEPSPDTDPKLQKMLRDLVDGRGIEPLTSALRMGSDPLPPYSTNYRDSASLS